MADSLPPKLTFEVWRRNFERLLIVKSRPWNALQKFKKQFGTTAYGAPFDSETVLQTELLREIYATSDVRPLSEKTRRECIFMRKRLKEIALLLDLYTKRVRKNGLIAPSEDGAVLFSMVELIHRFETASTAAHEALTQLRPKRSGKPDIINRCLALLIELESVVAEPDALALATIAMEAHGYTEDVLAVLNDMNKDGKRKGTIRHRKNTAMMEFWNSTSRNPEPPPRAEN